jgi:hypothetical protein
MVSLISIIEEIFGLAIRHTFPDIENPPVMIQKGKHTMTNDYQCNAAMNLNQVYINLFDVFFKAHLTQSVGCAIVITF